MHCVRVPCACTRNGTFADGAAPAARSNPQLTGRFLPGTPCTSMGTQL